MAAIRGDGLYIAHRALAALVEDPQLLERARRRFSESPPSYRTNPSGTTTLSHESNEPSEEERRRDERQFELRRERRASLPYYQFEGQVKEECRCLLKETSQDHHSPQGLWLPSLEIEERASENVKKRWIEQGIWRDKWDGAYRPRGPWKHEEPLEFESESETDSVAKPEPVFVLGLSKPEAKPRRPKGDVEMRQIAERRPVREREREASRPFYQFFYQVLKARERIQGESRVEGVPTEDSVDINTKAYENVKNTWIKRGIWNQKWGILPGMLWKHEHPFEELMADDPVLARLNMPEDHDHEAREVPPSTPPRGLFGSPRPIESSHSQGSGAQPEIPGAIDPAGFQNGNENTWIERGIWNQKWGILPGMSWEHEHPFEEPMADDPVLARLNVPEDHDHVAREAPPSIPPRGLFGSLQPIESSHSQVLGTQPELPVTIDPASFQNGNGTHLSPASRSSPAPRSRPRLTQSRQESSAAAQRPLRDARETSRGGRPEARAHLGPVNPSKVSKAPRKRVPVPPRPPSASGETLSAPMLPRRSKRLQEAKLGTAEDPSGIASADLFKDIAQSRPTGIAAGCLKSAASTKPRGVSKRRRLSTMRHRARQSN